MSSGLEVSGGAAGVAADIADVRRTAAVLDRCGHDLGVLAARTSAASASGALLATAAFSPTTFARAEAALLGASAGPGGLSLLALRLQALAAVLQTRARLLELADSGADLLRETRDRTVARAVGAAAPLLLVGVLVVGTGAVAGELVEEAGDLATDVLTGRVSPLDVDDRLREVPGEAAQDLQARALQLLVDHPQITDTVTGGLPDVLAGATWALPGLPLPHDLEGTVVALLAVGRTRGLFDDRPVQVALRPASVDARRLSWRSLADLLRNQEQLGKEAQAAAAGSTVRVRRVVQPSRAGAGLVRWIVQVPGTQSWAPVAGRDPSDVTSNLELMDDGQAALAAAVADAMAVAGVGREDAVLLTGHSQGGIAAVAVAGDPRVRERFRGIHDVVTAGSPVGRLPVPDDVHVLSLEHTSDPVPRLDGVDNPDRPGWTTVRRDVRAELPPSESGQPVAAHRVPRYVSTAVQVDASDDPALAPVRDRLAPFLGGNGDTVDVDLTRP